MYVQSSFPNQLLGSPSPQRVYVALDPSTQNQRDLFLGSLRKPIHTPCDKFKVASACCSACDVTMASLDPIASQVDFAAVQFNLPDETL